MVVRNKEADINYILILYLRITNNAAPYDPLPRYLIFLYFFNDDIESAELSDLLLILRYLDAIGGKSDEDFIHLIIC